MVTNTALLRVILYSKHSIELRFKALKELKTRVEKLISYFPKDSAFFEGSFFDQKDVAQLLDEEIFSDALLALVEHEDQEISESAVNVWNVMLELTSTNMRAQTKSDKMLEKFSNIFTKRG